MTLLNLSLIILLAVVIFIVTMPSEPKLGIGLPYPYVNENGILTFSYKISLRTGTNTPCSIRSPAATSTIVHASTDIRTSATSSLLVEIGKANNSGATTTSLGKMQLAANVLGTLVSSTTNDQDNLIINPLNYVNVRFGLPSGYSSGLNGNCEVIFRVVS